MQRTIAVQVPRRGYRIDIRDRRSGAVARLLAAISARDYDRRYALHAAILLLATGTALTGLVAAL